MATINGTNIEDNIYDTSGDDLITAYAGGDHIITSGGADTVYGGNGTDLIQAGGEYMKVWGGNQADLFTFLSWDTGSTDVMLIRDFDASEGDRLGVKAGTTTFDVQEVTLLGEDSLIITAYDGSSLLSQQFHLVGYTLAEYQADLVNDYNNVFGFGW